MANTVRATQSFHVGNRRIIHFGDILPATDPVIRGREHLFQAVGDGAPIAPKAARRKAPVAKKARGGAKKQAAPPATD